MINILTYLLFFVCSVRTILSQSMELSLGGFSEFYTQKKPMSNFFPTITQYTSIGLRLGFELDKKKGNWLFLMDIVKQKAGFDYRKLPLSFGYKNFTHSNDASMQLATIWLFNFEIGKKFLYKIGPGVGLRFALGNKTQTTINEYYVDYMGNRYDLNYVHITNSIFTIPLLIHTVLEAKLKDRINVFLSVDYKVGISCVYTSQIDYIHSINDNIIQNDRAIYVNRGSGWNANVGLKINLRKNG